MQLARHYLPRRGWVSKGVPGMDSLCVGAGESQTQKATGDRRYYRRKALFPSFTSRHEQASGAQPLCHLGSCKTCKFWVHSNLLNLKVLAVGPIWLDFLFVWGLIFIFYFFKTRSLCRPGWPWTLDHSAFSPKCHNFNTLCFNKLSRQSEELKVNKTRWVQKYSQPLCPSPLPWLSRTVSL